MEKLEVTPHMLGILMFIKMSTSKSEYIIDKLREDLYGEDTELLEELKSKDLVKFIKSGKKDELYRLRLSKKGLSVVNSVFNPPLHPESSVCWDILEKLYLDYEIPKEKVVNKTKTTNYISAFLSKKEESGKAYDRFKFEAIVRAYLNSFEYEDRKYVKRTLNLFFSPVNVFTTKWTPEECPLYSWINGHQGEIGEEYKRIMFREKNK